MLPASLRVLSERQNGTVIPLPSGRFLIGREEDCHLRPNSELVSRHHCVFTNDDITLRVRDLGSTNGTYVNGERLKGSVALNTGDRVTVGKLEFQVVIGNDAPPDVPALADDAPAGASADDTQFAAAANAETMTEMPAFAPQAGVPQVGTGDTAMFPAGAYPGAPGYMPQYPQPAYQYPGYPPTPGYAPMYPPGYYMPGMPYQGMPGYPQQGVPYAPPAAPEQPAENQIPETRLPDPETTGAKPPEPKPQGGSTSGAPAGSVPDSAESIIKNYLQRRPAGSDTKKK